MEQLNSAIDFDWPGEIKPKKVIISKKVTFFKNFAQSELYKLTFVTINYIANE